MTAMGLAGRRVVCCRRDVEYDGLQGLGGLMPRQAWHATLVNGSPRQYDTGEILMRQGDEGHFVLALTHGLVKVTRLESDGHELVLAVRGRGEVIGEITHLDHRRRSATVTSLSPCLTYIVPDTRFKRIVSDFALGDLVFSHVTARLRESEEIRAELTGLPSRRRLARTLLRLSPEGCCVLTQSDLAAAAGMSRSAVASELAWLRRRTLVRTGRRRIVIADASGLTSVADGWALVSIPGQKGLPRCGTFEICQIPSASRSLPTGESSPSIPCGSPATRVPVSPT